MALDRHEMIDVYRCIRGVPMTDLNLRLTVIQAIHLHGELTERIARNKHKLDSLVSMRAAITDVPDMSEGLLAENICNDTLVLDRLTTLLYGGTMDDADYPNRAFAKGVSDTWNANRLPEPITCSIEGHIPGCPGVAGGDHEWEDHDESHPDTVYDCAECERRAERSAEQWQRMTASY